MPVRLRQSEDVEPLGIDYRPVASLIPYARNARPHSETQVALIAGSIREYGFTNPVLVDGANGIIAEETPEPPTVPVSQRGDLWLLGRHRLLCGSATDPAAVARLCAGVEPHLMVTDPPYGVSYDPAWRTRATICAVRLSTPVMPITTGMGCVTVISRIVGGAPGRYMTKRP